MFILHKIPFFGPSVRNAGAERLLDLNKMVLLSQKSLEILPEMFLNWPKELASFKYRRRRLRGAGEPSLDLIKDFSFFEGGILF